MSDLDDLLGPDPLDWKKEAKKKRLPKTFVERLEKSETVTEDEKAKIVKAVVRGSDVPLTEEQEQTIRDAYGYSQSEKRTKAERDATANRIREKYGLPIQTGGHTREAAIELGRKLGENEADRRQEIGAQKENRIKRAMAYAAWEWDGKPTGLWWTKYRREFGFSDHSQHVDLASARPAQIVKEKK